MVVREVQPDLLHLNQYCYGDLAPGVPRVVVAHSDIVSWWVGVHGRENAFAVPAIEEGIDSSQEFHVIRHSILSFHLCLLADDC